MWSLDNHTCLDVPETSAGDFAATTSDIPRVIKNLIGSEGATRHNGSSWTVVPYGLLKAEKMAIGVSLMGHGFQDAVSLELARRIARGLPQHLEWLSVARANLDRWASQNRDAPSLLRCYEEWRELLDHPVEEICAALTAETENSQRIRQNSPFAGVLPPAEVWEIKARFRHATPAA